MAEKVYPPLPLDGSVSYGKPGYADWAFNLADAEGMPSPSGNRHGAVDWFAAGGTPVYAAVGGEVVELKPSFNTSGQVFGGVVKIRDAKDRIWVYRHVDPVVRDGELVKQGQKIATVTNWQGGPDHLHMEIWRSLAGGYRFSNAIDPHNFEYTPGVVKPIIRYYFERLVKNKKGELISAMIWIPGGYASRARRNLKYLAVKIAHPTWLLRKYSETR